MDDVFTRAAGARGRLLRVERRPAPGSADGAKEASEASEADGVIGAAFLLTFDVGRILVAVDGARGAVAARLVEESAPGLLLADEEEPWWRLLGSSLARCQHAPDGRETRLQFRETEDDPRLLRLAAEEGLLRASVESGALTS